MADDKSSLTDRLLAYAEKATKSVSDAWDKTMGMPEEIAKQTYDYVISKGGSEEEAQRIADRLAAKAGRTTGLIDLLVPQSPADVALMAAGPLGPATKMGKAALGAGAALTVMDPTEAEASPLSKLKNVFYRGIPRLEGKQADQISGLQVKERGSPEVHNPRLKANTGDYAWASDSPDVANSYTHLGGTVIPLELVEKPGAVLDAKNNIWKDWFFNEGKLNKEYAEALNDPSVKSILVKNIIDPGANSSSPVVRSLARERLNIKHDPIFPWLPEMYITPDEFMKMFKANNLLIKDPEVVRYLYTGETPKFAEGGEVQGYATGGPVTDEQIRGLYRNYFERDPESQAAIDYWRDTANQGGLTLSDIGQQFAGSEEGRQRYASLDQQLAPNTTVVEQTNAPDKWRTYWGYTPSQRDYTMMLRAGLGEYGTPQSYDQYRAIYEAIGNRAAANSLYPYYVRGDKTLAGQITPSQVEGAFATSRINSLLNSDDPQKVESLYLAQKALEDYFMEGKNRVLTTQTDWRGFQQGQPSPGTGFTNPIVPGGEELPIYNRFYDAYNNPDLTQRLAKLQEQQSALYVPPVPPSRPSETELAEYNKIEENPTTYQTFALGDPMSGNPFDSSWFSGPTVPTTFEQQAADDRAQALNDSLMAQSTFNQPTTYNPNYTLFSDANQFYGSQSSLPTLAVANTGLTDYGMFSSPGSLGEGASGLTSFSPSLSDYSSSWGSMGYSPMSWDYAKGGEVKFKPMFEGDNEKLQDRARELAREAYSRGPASMGREKAQEWEALARKYNLPLTVGPFTTYEDQYSDALSNWQRNVSPKQREQSFDKGGPVMPAYDPMGSFTGMDSIESSPYPREELEARLDPATQAMIDLQGVMIPNRAVDIKQDDLGYYPVDAEGNRMKWGMRPALFPLTMDEGNIRLAMPYIPEMVGNILGGVAAPVKGAGVALGAGPIRRGEKTLADLVDTYGVKKPGGNWTKDLDVAVGSFYEVPEGATSFDDSVYGAMTSDPVNKWIGTKLKSYIKNQMGTVADPLIDVAEVTGRLHIPSDELIGSANMLPEYRPFALNPNDKWTPTAGGGFSYNPNLIGETDLSRAWEKGTQASIARSLKEDWSDEVLKKKGLEALIGAPGDTQINVPRAIAHNRFLGFDHLVDELRNATAPNSNLPDRLKIDPAKLEKYSMSQAVEHVAKINEWREAQRAKAKIEASRNAATVPFKQYDVVPETNYPNERGLGWVQIKSTGNKDELEKALKYEGDTMGHCVGGGSYCPQVEAGKTEIYSLRDSKGEPHVTIEVRRMKNPRENPNFDIYENTPPEIREQMIDRAQDLTIQRIIDENREDYTAEAYNYVRKRFPELDEESDDFYMKVQDASYDIARKKAIRNENYDDYFMEELTEIQMKELEKLQDYDQEIFTVNQIKGKGNAKPVDEYIPFVQDFIKSRNWYDVVELRNANMVQVFEGQRLPGSAEKIPPGYYTLKDLGKLAADKGVPESTIQAWIKVLRNQ